MRIKKTDSIISLIACFGLASLILFADAIGLDDHAGWGRLRTISFLLCLSAGVLSFLPLLFPHQTEELLGRIKEVPLVISLLNSKPAVLLREYAFLLPIMGFVFLIYIWLVSSGTWVNWRSPTRYYANLARGFERGNLYISTPPDPKLEEISDPYDDALRIENGIDIVPDASYYNGRYYLYWGPVPAVFLIPVQSAYGGKVGDMQLVFFFTCGIFLVLSQFFILVRNRFFPNLPRWMLGMSILLAGTASPVMYMLNGYNSAMIYEAAITGGQFFLASGILAAATSLGARASYWRLALTGMLWALAIGTRLNLMLPVAAMSFILLVSWFSVKGHYFEKFASISSLAFPLLLGGAVLGWYNWARFGSITEFGLSYQLAWLHPQKHYDDLFRVVYILQNIYNYVFRAFAFRTEFPFLYIEWGIKDPILASYPLPNFYNTQQITGILFTTPFFVFAFAPLSWFISGKSRMFLQQNNSLLWFLLMLASSSLAAFLFLMTFFWSAMRYLLDFVPSLLALSVIGFWQGYTLLSDSPAHKVYIFFGSSLAGASILVSILLAISINDARFQIIRFLELLS